MITHSLKFPKEFGEQDVTVDLILQSIYSYICDLLKMTKRDSASDLENLRGRLDSLREIFFPH